MTFPQRSRSEDVCEAFEAIGSANGSRPVIVILDDFMAHHSEKVAECAEESDIFRVFLPPYSPHLDPMEFIWKTLKRIVSKVRMISRDHMTGLLGNAFTEEASKDTYFRYWTELFHEELFKLVR